MKSTVSRNYSSQSRQANAELTKKRILDAAKTLFSEKGFEKSTIGDVAELAEVSAPSVYALYKSKEGLVRELLHSVIFGEQYQSLVATVVTTTDPVELLRTSARITCLICEAEKAEMGFIRGAALISPALKALEQEGEKIRYERQEVLVRRLFDEKMVRVELDYESARDILWMLTSRDMYRLMVVERQWSPEKYERWLADTLLEALVRKDADPQKDRG